MSNKTYPRIGSSRTYTRPGKEGHGKCQQCNKPIQAGDKQVGVDIEYNYMRGDDDVAVLCTECGKHPDLKKLIKLAGGDPEATWSFGTTTETKEGRYKDAQTDFADAVALARQYSFELTCKTPTHYQLRDRQRDFIINLYPGNQRIYADPQHARPPMLREKLPEVWRLTDIVKALAESIS